MYPAQALSRILAVQPVLDSLERDQATQHNPFEHLTLGQSLTGLVKSLSKGVALVEIEGQTVAMRPPHPPAVGETLHLRFAGNMPQPVFLLETPETPADEAPQLSSAARMLSNLVQRLPQRNAVPMLTPPVPLLDAPAAHPAELALALRTAVVRSGLFYESHLANWAVGMDTLDGLMQEPQNRLAVAHAIRHMDVAEAVGRLDGGPSPRDAGVPAPLAGQPPLNPMHALLSQQLQVLESPQFIWRGEVWPDLPVEWQIRREASEEHGTTGTPPPDAPAHAWESSLHLTLPRLGSITVSIRLDARQTFSIRMTADEPAVAPLLQQHRVDLARQLADAGCAVQSLTVQDATGG